MRWNTGIKRYYIGIPSIRVCQQAGPRCCALRGASAWQCRAAVSRKEPVRPCTTRHHGTVSSNQSIVPSMVPAGTAGSTAGKSRGTSSLPLQRMYNPFERCVADSNQRSSCKTWSFALGTVKKCNTCGCCSQHDIGGFCSGKACSTHA